jgi:hypothetical protein
MRMSAVSSGSLMRMVGSCLMHFSLPGDRLNRGTDVSTQTPDDEWARQALALLMERVKRAVRLEYARLARELL